MLLKLNAKNEYPVYPDIQENLSLPENERFTVVLRKLSVHLHGTQWATLNDTGKVSVDLIAFARAHIVRFNNPPDIQTEEGDSENHPERVQKLTPDMLLSCEYPALNGVLEFIITSAQNLDQERVMETKEL